MPPVNNLINQNLTDPSRTSAGQIAVGQQAEALQEVPSRAPGLRTGTVVTGRVLVGNQDGTYAVRIDGQGANPPLELRARATLTLVPGERFTALWDASGGGVPVLRLSKEELSFLAQVPQRDRGLATALLSREMPLSGEVLAVIRDAWRRMGSDEGQIAPLVELWARGVSLSAENVSLLAGYTALDAAAASEMWNRIRRELKERARKGQNPLEALREMKEGNGKKARFLQAHSLLMRTPRKDVNPMLLAAPFWPLPEAAGGMTARVFVGRSAEEEGQRYWQAGFGLTGSALGAVAGVVETDGRGCNVLLTAESAAACGLLEARRGELRQELVGAALLVRFIGISRGASQELRERLLAGRGLDVTV